jgi:hypothetical protein
MYFLKNLFMNKIFSFFVLSLCTLTLSSCNKDEDPVKEDAPELITQVVFTFVPVTGETVVVTATDPDGSGLQNLQVDGPAQLTTVPYTLTITLFNTLLNPNEDGYDITEEVTNESDEHLFFYSWTNNIFSNPTGDGNIDDRADPVNYQDEDTNGLPLGLKTYWVGSSGTSGQLKVVLKHQPETKSATSTSSDGETDLDVTITINVN